MKLDYKKLEELANRTARAGELFELADKAVCKLCEILTPTKAFHVLRTVLVTNPDITSQCGSDGITKSDVNIGEDLVLHYCPIETIYSLKVTRDAFLKVLPEFRELLTDAEQKLNDYYQFVGGFDELPLIKDTAWFEFSADTLKVAHLGFKDIRSEYIPQGVLNEFFKLLHREKLLSR